MNALSSITPWMLRQGFSVQRLCAFPVTSQTTSYSTKAQRKEALALFQLQCCPALHAHSFGIQAWIQAQTHSIPLELSIFCTYWCFPHPSNLPGSRSMNDANAVHGFHTGKQRISSLYYAVTASPQAALSNYFHFVPPKKPNWNY